MMQNCLTICFLFCCVPIMAWSHHTDAHQATPLYGTLKVVHCPHLTHTHTPFPTPDPAALAGMRVGFGAFPLAMIEFLWRAKQPYNVSVAAEVAAVAALTNMPYLDNVRNALISERDRLYTQLCTVPYLSPYTSHANFVLCKVSTSSIPSGCVGSF